MRYSRLTSKAQSFMPTRELFGSSDTSLRNSWEAISHASFPRTSVRYTNVDCGITPKRASGSLTGQAQTYRVSTRMERSCSSGLRSESSGEVINECSRGSFGRGDAGHHQVL